ncbi:MAG TPA: alkaline phosphatase family protein [Longimicrobiales bacterium]|nr:alkaline phosphatase family protein [Longimicrobiales bacterium]
MRILMVFLDGVGIGVDDPEINPFARAELPAFRASDATTVPLDATLGISGLPQSGTGQTALLTGVNAAREFGRHFGPWVPTTLRAMLAEQNVMSRVQRAGCIAAFANAYPEEIFQTPDDRRLNAGPPIAALGAKLLNRHTEALMAGDAVSSEITNESWRKHLNRTQLPVITPQDAGKNLARIAAQHDFTLFAHYSTDYVGHRNNMEESVRALETVDAFLTGLRAAIPDDLLVMCVSDHGNIEDVRAGHTTNPALGFFFGNNHSRAAKDLTVLTDVTPRALQLLDINTP